MILGGTKGNGIINSSSYLTPFFHQTATSSANDTAIPMLAGDLSNFKVVLSAAPGAGDSWTFHIARASGTGSLTDVSGASCTIAETATSCTIAGPVTFADGDLFTVHAVEGGNAAQTRVAYKANYTFN
jgi:hypothetical protein